MAGRTDFRAQRTEPTSFADMRPGCFDVHARIADMDLAGIWASVNFPSVITGFCGTVFAKSDDRDLGRAVMQAWNDWFFEDWYGPYPQRMVPMGITWLTDPVLGADEVRRNAARGFRAVTLPELPHWLDLPAIVADPSPVVIWVLFLATACPGSSVTTLGARSAKRAGRRPSNISGGSTRWSSTEMTV